MADIFEYAEAAVVILDGVKIIVNKAGETWGAVDKFLHSGHGRHNFMEGDPEVGDVILKQSYRRPTGRFPEYRTEDFVYHCKPGETITAVIARDHWDDNTGGEATLVSGGPGEDHVKLHITSRMWRGFEFTVIVSGKRQ